MSNLCINRNDQIQLSRKRKPCELDVVFSTLSVEWIELFSCEWYLSTLFEYFDVKDIIRMDTTMCNTFYRSKWLECISQDFGDLSNRIQRYFYNEECIQWCAKNNIKFKMLNLKELEITSQGMILLAKQSAQLKELTLCVSLCKTITVITKYCQQLQYLEISGVKYISDKTLSSIGYYCSNLKGLKLFINEDSITQVGMIGLLTNCLKLTKFTCHNKQKCAWFHLFSQYCSLMESIDIVFSDNDTEQHFEAFTKKCKNLKCVILQGSGLIPDMVFKHLGSNSCLLEVCHFFHVFRQTRDNVMRVSCNGLKYLAHGCPLLKSLDIECSVTDIHVKTVRQFVDCCSTLEYLNLGLSVMSDDVLVELGKCSSLKKLYVGSKVTDIGIIALVSNNHNLEDIDIRSCKLLTDASLIAIGNNCTHLKRVNFSSNHNFTDVGIESFIANNCKLETILINNCQLLTDASLVAIGKNCPHLKILNASKLNITDNGVKALVTNCRKLEDINLWHCQQLNDSSLIAIGVNCLYLRKVNVSDVFNLTDFGIKFLVAKNHQLLSMDISYCQQLTDNSLFMIGKKCHHLKTISVGNNDNITDCGIAALILNNRNIESLDISYCDFLTNFSLIVVGDNCPNLKRLYCETTMETAATVTRVGFQYVFQKCKQLTIENLYGVL